MAYQKFKDRQKSPAKRFLVVLGVVMFLVYLTMGIAIIFWDKFPLMIGVSIWWKVALGVLLIAYSFFRFIRLIKNQQHE